MSIHVTHSNIYSLHCKVLHLDLKASADMCISLAALPSVWHFIALVNADANSTIKGGQP